MRLIKFLRKLVSTGPQSIRSNTALRPATTTIKYEDQPTSTIGDLLDFLQSNRAVRGMQFNAGASERDLAAFEKHLFQLPEDFRMLYQFSDGFETAEDIFRVIPLSEISEDRFSINSLEKKAFDFCEYLIYIDSWTVKVNSNDRNDYTICNGPYALTKSLTEFLTVFINQGLYEGLLSWNVRAGLGNEC